MSSSTTRQPLLAEGTRFAPPSPMTVGLLTNETKPAALEEAQKVAEWLRNKGVAVLARDVLARALPPDMCAPSDDDAIARADFVVVFGGDGTLLAAARLAAPADTPLLSVHLGNFGFITEVAPGNLFAALERVLAGNCQVEERLMLAGVLSGREGNRALLAVNDIVIASGAVRMIHVRTAIGGAALATYAADGVIVSTPTGSTGYSLSAGGPLVHPAAPVLIIAPICPHTLNARPLVVPANETIELRLEPHTRDAGVVSVDGQIEYPLYPGETVTVFASPHRLRLLTVGGPTFYEKIRSRWHYGERESA